MSDKLQDAVKMLRDYCGGIPLSNAIIYIINNNIYILETIDKLREENNNCKSQYQHWDERYSEALIKMREMKEEIERLKTEVYLYKSSMNHYKGITLKNKKIRDEIIESRDIVVNRNIEILAALHEINPRIWEEVIKRVSENHKDESVCAMPYIFDEEES